MNTPANVQPAEPAELANGSIWRRLARFCSVVSDDRQDFEFALENASVITRHHQLPPQSAPAVKRVPVPLAPTPREPSSIFRPQPIFEMDKYMAGLACRLAGVKMTALWRICEGKDLVLFAHASGSTLAIELSQCSAEAIRAKVHAANKRFGILEVENESALPSE